MMRRLIPCLLLALTLAGAPAAAQRAETNYNPAITFTDITTPGETTYRAVAAPSAIQAPPPPASQETSYNPLGTRSTSGVGLLSTRRGSLGDWPNHLLGLQDAASRRFGEPLNVAPAVASTVTEQLESLKQVNAETYILDAPDPAAARGFMNQARFLKRPVALVTHTMPNYAATPIILTSPLSYGESVGEEAIRLVGNTEVTVAWVAPRNLPSGVSAEFRDQLIGQFKKPFGNVAPKIVLQEIDPDTVEAGLTPPTVVALLTAEDSRLYIQTLRGKLPSAQIVAVGESKEVIDAFEKKQIRVRLRPDYDRILGAAMAEVRNPSNMPIILRPAVDKHFEW